ncbi:MAG: aldo/keto reductase [Bacteroidales bacterium]|nr:aldo/keto reductase [Bacteroidales bacterium]
MKTITRIATIAAMVLLASCGGHKAYKENPDMNYRTLGSTEIRVGEIGIGCGAFGKLDSAASKELLGYAMDHGVNYIDIYDADPKVRSNIGYAIEGRRNDIVIQGHIGCYWNGESYVRTRDVEKCREGFEDLLQRLGTDHIEVGMMHIFDSEEEWDSIQGTDYIAYVQQLKAEGKIGHIGISSHNVNVALKAAKSGLVEVIMFSLNPAFDRVEAGVNVWDPANYKKMLPGIDPVRMELYDYCASHNIAITVMKVFGGGGKLLDAQTSPFGVALTPSQCIAYSLAKPCVAVAICGADNIEELEADLHYLKATDEEKDYLQALNPATAMAATSTGCTYCRHCAPCPAGIDIARVNELLDKAEQAGGVNDELAAQYKQLQRHAGDCIECAQCEGRCPFDVPVRERMKKAVATFGY